MESIKKLFSKKKKTNVGKKIRMSDKKIKEILEHQGNVSEFCRAKRITRQRYYRYKNWETEIKNDRDRKRFEKIEKEIEYEKNTGV